jgi:virginiamycin A acetyltransferase
MLANFIVWLYGLSDTKVFRQTILRLVTKFDGGDFYSPTLRRIFEKYHDVKVGMYTGRAFTPGHLDRFTTVGRYCSIPNTLRTVNHDHPIDYKSTHAFFFNPILGRCKKDLAHYVPLDIGNDVWFGHNVVVMPNCRRIGDGAVIGSGSIVHTDVPPYAIVVGNPARVVRYRFPATVIEQLLQEKWWEKSIDDLIAHLAEYQRPYVSEIKNPEAVSSQ